MLSQVEGLKMKINMFGLSNLIEKKEQEKEKLHINERPSSCILMPQSRFKMVWNFIIILLLLYTSTYVPYRVAFVDDSSTAYTIFEYFVDMLFFIDIFVNFFSAIERPDGTIEVKCKKIAKAYLTSWFILDIVATIPTQAFENLASGEDAGSSNYNKLIRLARLPRLYRLLRILRLFKIVKILNSSVAIQKFMDRIKMNAGVGRMIAVLIFAFFCVHLISCFWFLAAKLSDFEPNTWVARLGV